MFFSRITLRKDASDNSEFWRFSDDEYSLHQTIWKLFGDDSGKKRDFLYRIETIGRRPLIYTVSERKPINISPLWDVEIKDYNPKIKQGERFGFVLRANPTVRRDGKRHDVVMDFKKREHKSMTNNEIIQIAGERWLSSRSEKNGFKVEQVRIDGYFQHRLAKRKNNAEVRYSTIDITGIISIINPELFLNLLHKGIGAEKSFGCGLMIIRRI